MHRRIARETLQKLDKCMRGRLLKVPLKMHMLRIDVSRLSLLLQKTDYWLNKNAEMSLLLVLESI